MMIEGLIVLGILVVALIAFATERVRVDLVALSVMVVLMVLGIITPMEGLAGFSNPATVTIAAMFVLSSGLQRTNLPTLVGTHIINASNKSETRMILLLMSTTAILSAFILNTAVVAVFIPIVLRISKTMDIPPSRLLMPTSFGAILGGTLTLIGTSTNLLVSSIAVQAGLPPLRCKCFKVSSRQVRSPRMRCAHACRARWRVSLASVEKVDRRAGPGPQSYS